MSKKLEKYERLYEQISHYVVTTPDRWARLATIEAVLHHKMQLFFWTGVYVLVEGELIVRSYQGPVAEITSTYRCVLGCGRFGKNSYCEECGRIFRSYRL